MAAPNLTPEQRSEALRKAAESRKIRADFKNRLANGELTPKDALTKARHDDVLGRMKVDEFLRSIPHVGRVRAETIMAESKINATRRLRGLGVRQQQALAQAIQ